MRSFFPRMGMNPDREIEEAMRGINLPERKIKQRRRFGK